MIVKVNLLLSMVSFFVLILIYGSGVDLHILSGNIVIVGRWFVLSGLLYLTLKLVKFFYKEDPSSVDGK